MRQRVTQKKKVLEWAGRCHCQIQCFSAGSSRTDLRTEFVRVETDDQKRVAENNHIRTGRISDHRERLPRERVTREVGDCSVCRDQANHTDKKCRKKMASCERVGAGGHQKSI